MTPTQPLLKAAEISGLTVHAMDLWQSPGLADPVVRGNAGLEEARALLAAARARWPGHITEHEVASDEEGAALYAKFAQASASPGPDRWWDYVVSGVLGTNKYPGSWAARQVPLLVIRFDGIPAPFCAPHQTRRTPGGSRARTTRTIRDVLGMLGAAEQSRLFGHPVM